ncbi:class I SAM-dependent methyltransferase [Microbacterium ulmi]|uniref:Methyltransferase domain-containing protein n=1 Tax=Microbacterium ulmi TaxID=179095 RepID=A0A7Y2PZF8_9MICO|nr:class I SAM-dependent methyltransferase [Microbacterium ulmi]NII69780.1 methylase of polypeptide subunit release factors [Microbacterium ulmi]NNH03248.1 hypothetical protein [Microbacterium ulmi]
MMDAVPRGAVSALDVGTGDGLLDAGLRRVFPDVSAIDLDASVLARARSGCQAAKRGGSRRIQRRSNKRGERPVTSLIQIRWSSHNTLR